LAPVRLFPSLMKPANPAKITWNTGFAFVVLDADLVG
jgi:hypothetical protein